MQFNDTTNLNGIIQEIERMTDLGSTYISGDATRLKDFTSTINRVSSRVWHTIFMSSGNWQYDDSNNTDLPQSTTNLVSAQRKYTIPSDALTIQRIECKDASGQWYELKPITKEMVHQGLDEFMKSDSQPMYYRLLGNTLEMFPASNYASTAGMKVYYDRGSVAFVSTATTATPGFAGEYHEIIPIGASIEWLKVKQPNTPSLTILTNDYLKIEDNIKKFYGKRFKDMKPAISRLKESYK
jgi:hypothetical protein